MMSVHPSYCVSTQILDKLIEITLNNGEYLRDGELTTEQNHLSSAKQRGRKKALVLFCVSDVSQKLLLLMS